MSSIFNRESRKIHMLLPSANAADVRTKIDNFLLGLDYGLNKGCPLLAEHIVRRFAGSINSLMARYGYTYEEIVAKYEIEGINVKFKCIGINIEDFIDADSEVLFNPILTSNNKALVIKNSSGDELYLKHS